MSLLVAGLATFVGAHLLPSFPSVRNAVRRRMGSGAYMGVFSIVALAGLVMIVVGTSRAPFVHLWTPPFWGRTVAIWAMPVALTLFVGAYLPSNLKRFTRHPMLWGVTIWAAVHLFANGDLASLLLFGGLGAFSLFDMWSSNRRGAEHATRALPWWRDAVLVGVGLILYFALLHGHGWLFGAVVTFSPAP